MTPPGMKRGGYAGTVLVEDSDAALPDRPFVSAKVWAQHVDNMEQQETPSEAQPSAESEVAKARKLKKNRKKRTRRRARKREEKERNRRRTAASADDPSTAGPVEVPPSGKREKLSGNSGTHDMVPVPEPAEVRSVVWAVAITTGAWAAQDETEDEEKAELDTVSAVPTQFEWCCLLACSAQLFTTPDLSWSQDLLQAPAGTHLFVGGLAISDTHRVSVRVRLTPGSDGTSLSGYIPVEMCKIVRAPPSSSPVRCLGFHLRRELVSVWSGAFLTEVVARSLACGWQRGERGARRDAGDSASGHSRRLQHCPDGLWHDVGAVGERAGAGPRRAGVAVGACLRDVAGGSSLHVLSVRHAGHGALVLCAESVVCWFSGRHPRPRKRAGVAHVHGVQPDRRSDVGPIIHVETIPAQRAGIGGVCVRRGRVPAAAGI